MVNQKHEKKDANLLIALVLLISIGVFFGLAFSSLNIYLKLLLIILTLSLCGTLVHKFTGIDSFYGVLIIRGLTGFKAMRDIANNYAKQCRWIADLGLGMSFGSIYHYFVFKKEGKKLLIQQLLIIIFFAGFFVNQQNPGDIQSWVVLLLGWFSGLFGLGLFFLAKHAVDVLTIPGTAAGVVPLVPGVTVPYESIIAIVIIAAVHELAHGVLANIEKLPLKSSGAILYGFLPIGAFVEPDEKAFEKLELHKKRRVLIAGSTSNLVFFFVFAIIALALNAALAPLVSHAAVSTIMKNQTADGILEEGEALYAINGVETKNLGEVQKQLSKYKERDKISLTTDKGVKQVTLGKNGKMGIEIENKPLPEWSLLYSILAFLLSIVALTYFFNFMLATINLLPLFITDGQKLIYEELAYWLGPKLGQQITLVLSIFTLLLVIANALPWFI